MVLLLAVIFFIFGLIIGSFLNVVIYRLNTKRSLGGRSACMSCRNQLSWQELIPVFSFLGLKGRCKNCKTKISFQYPLVEFATGLVFACLFIKFQDIFFLRTVIFAVTYVYYAAMFSLLLVIAVYDLKHKIIPDVLCFVFGALAFIGMFFFHATAGQFSDYLFHLHLPSMLEFLSGIFIALPFAFFWFISSGRWMGFGDAKLALGIGWLLGLVSALSALVVAFWSGAIVGLAMIIVSKVYRKNGIGMKSEIPFAPFIALGALLVFIFGFNFFGI